MPETIEMTTDEELQLIRDALVNGGGITYREAVSLLLRLDFERKRADDLQQKIIDMTADDLEAATERIRDDGREFQRRLWIWEHAARIYEACIAADRGATFKDCLGQAHADYTAFTATMDAENGGGE